MKKLFRTFAMTVAALALTAGIAMAALSVDAAKSQGLVGERTDGMLGVVVSSPDTNALVASTNAERLRKYQAIAAKNGTGLEQVKALAGKKLIVSAKAGEYVQAADGSWQKK